MERKDQKASRFWLITGSVVGALMAVALAIPTLISTHWGTARVLERINSQIPGHIQVGSLDLGWFSGLRVSNIEVRDPRDKVVATVDSLVSDVSPVSLLLGRREFGNVALVGLHADLIQNDTRVTNLHQSLVPAAITAAAVTHRTGSDFPDELVIEIPFGGHFTLSKGAITLSGPDISLMSFSDIGATLDSDLSKGVAQFTLSGRSQQDELAGHFAVEASLKGLDRDGRLLLKPTASGIPLPESDGEVRLKVDIDNASVALFDQVLTIGTPRMTGVLAEALGPTLNLKIDTLLTSAGPQIEVEGNSAHLHADLVTKLSDGKLILERPGKLSLRLTPELFDRLARLRHPGEEPSVALKEEIGLDIEFERLSLPTLLSKSELAKPTLRVKLGLDNVTLLKRDKTGSIELTGVSGLLERLEASKAFVFSFNGSVDYAGQSGLVRFGGKLVDNAVSGHYDGSDIVLSATRLPTAMLDYFAGGDGVLVDILGSNIDLQAGLQWTDKNPLATLQLGSDTLSIPTLQMAVTEEGLRLVNPTQARLRVSPAMFKFFALSSDNLKLEANTDVLVTLNDLVLPLDARDFLQSAKVDAQAATAPFVVAGLTGQDQGRARLSNVKLHVDGPTLSQLHFDLRGDIAPDGVTPLLNASLGAVSAFEVEGRLEPTILGSDVRVSLQNEAVDVQATVRVDSEGTITLTSPATLHYSVKPEVLLALGLLEPGAPHISENTPLQLYVEEMSWNLYDEDLHSLHSKGRLQARELHIVDDRDTVVTGLNNLVLAWHFNGSEQLASASLQAKSDDGGSIQGSVKATLWEDPSESTVQADISVEKLPTTVLEALTGKAALSTLAGDRLDISLQAQYDATTPNKPGDLKADVKGTDLHLSARLILGGEKALLTTAKPVVLVWTATSERLDALSRLLSVSGMPGALPWTLSKPSVVSAVLSDFTIPWHHTAGLVDADEPVVIAGTPSFKATMLVDGLTAFDRSTGESVTLDKGVLDLSSENIEEAIAFKLYAKEQSPRGNNNSPTEVILAGHLDNLYHDHEWFSAKAMGVTAKVEAKELPLVSLLRYPLQRASVSEELPGLIGSYVDGTVAIQMHQGNGSISANLIGDGGSLELDGEVRDHVLTLKTPLQLELEVTQGLREGLLRDVAPFAAAVTTTEKPVRFTIDPEGFAFPLDTSNFKSVKVPRATLDLGKVQLDDTSALGSVIAVLQGQRKVADSVNVWFTPIDLSMSDGIIRLQRTDSLVADRFPIAIWGKVDLAKDRVRMTVGLTSQALREAYSVLHVDDNYMLQIPLTGTVDNISIDRAKATARVTALVAQSHGSPQVAMLGGVIDILSGAKDEPVPPPRRPLPWEQRKQEREVTGGEERTR